MDVILRIFFVYNLKKEKLSILLNFLKVFGILADCVGSVDDNVLVFAHSFFDLDKEKRKQKSMM